MTKIAREARVRFSTVQVRIFEDRLDHLEARPPNALENMDTTYRINEYTERKRSNGSVHNRVYRDEQSLIKQEKQHPVATVCKLFTLAILYYFIINNKGSGSNTGMQMGIPKMSADTCDATMGSKWE